MKWLAVIILCLASPLAAAQSKPGEYVQTEDGEQPDDPYRDPGRTLPYLAYTLGQLHYLAYACEGNDSQEWRDRMIELLDLEAPVSGYRRSRLIDSFNDGYQVEQQSRTHCGAEAEAQRRQLSRRGALMSRALLENVLD